MKALKANDYLLIQGMPGNVFVKYLYSFFLSVLLNTFPQQGTGKSTTVALLIRVLLCLGKSVLITSYTHSALDSILMKLHERGVDFLRLGHNSNVLSELQKYTSKC
jgi:hypothetical protein